MQGCAHVPFPIARVFFVRAPADSVRGQHAHRVCSQFLVCASGRVDVCCDDGKVTMDFVLDNPKVGLLIPSGVWAEQSYRTSGSVLTVLCDRPYEESDYIREYESFKRYIAMSKTP